MKLDKKFWLKVQKDFNSDENYLFLCESPIFESAWNYKDGVIRPLRNNIQDIAKKFLNDTQTSHSIGNTFLFLWGNSREIRLRFLNWVIKNVKE